MHEFENIILNEKRQKYVSGASQVGIVVKDLPANAGLSHQLSASGSFPMNQVFTSVAKVLALQLQCQSFQGIFRVDFF